MTIKTYIIRENKFTGLKTLGMTQAEYDRVNSWIHSTISENLNLEDIARGNGINKQGVFTFLHGVGYSPAFDLIDSLGGLSNDTTDFANFLIRELGPVAVYQNLTALKRA